MFVELALAIHSLLCYVWLLNVDDEGLFKDIIAYNLI